jgi:Domain of unknown function (DUF4333)
MPSLSRTLGPVIVLVAAALALTGCNKVKKEVVEDMLKQELQKKGHPLSSASCPDGLELKDSNFECTGVDASGKSLPIKVHLRPTEGGKADIRFSVVVDGKTLSN